MSTGMQRLPSNPKPEGQAPKKTRSSNSEASWPGNRSQRGARISVFRLLSVFGLLISIFALSPAAAQTNTNTASRLDYPSFKIIADRNIFNPHRRAGEISRASRQSRARRVDSISLVGIMSYAKGPFAFFDSTSSEYRKVLKPGDSIAGYKVTTIQPNSAKLASSTNEIELRVGMQLRREDNGNWRLGASSETFSSSNSASKLAGRVTGKAGTNAEPTDVGGDADPQVALTEPSEVGTTNAEPAAPDSTETDPVLRRLMERRNQEINR
jgi:hypothetical protein